MFILFYFFVSWDENSKTRIMKWLTSQSQHLSNIKCHMFSVDSTNKCQERKCIHRVEHYSNTHTHTHIYSDSLEDMDWTWWCVDVLFVGLNQDEDKTWDHEVCSGSGVTLDMWCGCRTDRPAPSDQLSASRSLCFTLVFFLFSLQEPFYCCITSSLHQAAGPPLSHQHQHQISLFSIKCTNMCLEVVTKQNFSVHGGIPPQDIPQQCQREKCEKQLHPDLQAAGW